MIFSEYTTKVQQGKVDEYLSMLPKFLPLYQKYGIKFVGAWKHVDSQDEAVWMTGFREPTAANRAAREAKTRSRVPETQPASSNSHYPEHNADSQSCSWFSSQVN